MANSKHKIVVTGGAGFIGSHVAQVYCDAGLEVVVIDNLSSGKKENIPAAAKFYKADICDAKAMGAIFEKEKPTVVNHHAAQIDVQTSIANPAEDAQINICGGLNLLELSRKHGVEQWIYASSGGALYGEIKNAAATETAAVNPISPYGISKYGLEKYIELYGRLYNLNYSILRYANVYGPRQIAKAEGGVVAIFIQNILKGEAPTIYGDGNQSRDYVFVEDVAEANVQALPHHLFPDRRPALRAKQVVGLKNREKKIINIATGVEASILGLFDSLKKELKFHGNPKFAPQRPGEIVRSLLDPSLAKRILNWEATASLKEGLQKTIAWTRSFYML